MGAETTVETMEALYSVYPEADVKIVLIAMIVGCLFSAFFSFRLFKFTVVTYGVCLGFLIGLSVFGLLAADAVVGLVVGVLLAIIFGILSLKFCKIMIYLYGAMLGADMGYTIACELFTQLGLESVGPVVGIFLGFLLAMLGSFLLYKFFKQYVIIGTSVTGSFLATFYFYILMFGDDLSKVEMFSILWLVLSGVSMYCQFKMCKDYELDL